MVQRVELSDADVAYLVGRGGATRMRLERFSGSRLNIDRDCAEVEGTDQQRELAKLAIRITLQQRSGGTVSVDFDSLEQREDVSTFDVPKETVGFLLGAKGSTLRDLETKHKVFMFFNNERMRQSRSGAQCKRLYVIGAPGPRADALDEAEDVVRFKLTGESRLGGRGGGRGGPGNGGGGPLDSYNDSSRGGGPPPPRDRYDDRYDDRGPPPPGPPPARPAYREDPYYDRGGAPPPRS